MNIKTPRGLFTALFILFALIAGGASQTLAVGNGRLGELDPTFNPVVLGTNIAHANAILPQPDGKILYAGYFLTVERIARNYIVRFNADGTLDSSFDSGGTVDGEINSMALEPDGMIVVVGAFSHAAGQLRQSIARLNADGSLDPTFKVNFSPADSVFISTGVAVEADGKIVFAGNFNGPLVTIDGQRRDYMARVNSDGSLDTSFTAPATCLGNLIVIQPDGKIINNSSCQANNQGIARLAANGSLDTSFNPGTGVNGSAVSALILQGDGKLLIGGGFSTFNGQPRKGIARLNADGSLDPGFIQTVDTTFKTRAIALQPDGKVVTARTTGGIGGGISPVIRLNADGTSDPGFHSTDIQGGAINALAIAPDGSVYEGGQTMTFENSVISVRPFLHLGGAGAIDDTFNPYVVYADSQLITNIVVQPDGKILAGGTSFSEVNRQARDTLVRFNSDGTLDPTFTLGAGLASRPTAMVLQPDGKILLNTAGTARVIRLNSNGSRDTSFAIPDGADANVLRLALLPTGKILVAGDFTTIGGQTRSAHFARLNSDGSVDSFNPFVGNAFSMLVEPDGKFVVSGVTSVNGTVRNGYARINTDDSLDTTFTNTNVGGVYVARQADGKFIVDQGGYLVRVNADNTLDGTFHNNAFYMSVNNQGSIKSVVAQPDGKIVVGGQFYYAGNYSQVHPGIARLNADGSVDNTYINYGGTGTVYQVALQADGKVLLCGGFNTVNNFGHSALARLNGSVMQANRIADFDGDGRADLGVFRPSDSVWYLQRSTAGASAVNWGLGTDKMTAADFDGDGKTDIAVWRESESNPDVSYYYVLRSSDNTLGISQFGRLGDDTRVTGDWDGDGKADTAVYRNAAVGNQSYFYYRGSLNNPSGDVTYIPWGTDGDKPVRGDFDGDGKLDAAVYRPSDGTYYIRRSSDGGSVYRQFGSAGDKIVNGDFDGDGRDDIAVFRSSTGIWYIWESSSNHIRYQQFGLATDTLVPADYDGDGKTDVAVYRNGTWYIRQSSDGQILARNFGTATDIPVESVFNQ